MIDKTFQLRRILAEGGPDDRKRRDPEKRKTSSKVREKLFPPDGRIVDCPALKTAEIEAAKAKVEVEKNDERMLAMRIRRLRRRRDGEMIDPIHRLTLRRNLPNRLPPGGAAEWILVSLVHPIQHCRHYDHHLHHHSNPPIRHRPPIRHPHLFRPIHHFHEYQTLP